MEPYFAVTIDDMNQRLRLQSQRPTLADHDDEQQKSAFGSCDNRMIERLKRECICDGGRP
jgi:hypothetical protein